MRQNPHAMGTETLWHHSEEEGPEDSMGSIYMELGEQGKFIKALQSPAMDT